MAFMALAFIAFFMAFGAAGAAAFIAFFMAAMFVRDECKGVQSELLELA